MTYSDCVTLYPHLAESNSNISIITIHFFDPVSIPDIEPVYFNFPNDKTNLGFAYWFTGTPMEYTKWAPYSDPQYQYGRAYVTLSYDG